MKIVANLNTNLPNMRAQLAGLEALRLKVATSISELTVAIAQQEMTFKDMREKAAAGLQARTARLGTKYPPYCKTARSQAAYRKQLAREDRQSKRTK